MGNHHDSAERGRTDSRGNSGAAAISGEASDSQGEVGSKQLGASAANQPRGSSRACLPPTSAWSCLSLYLWVHTARLRGAAIKA